MKRILTLYVLCTVCVVGCNVDEQYQDVENESAIPLITELEGKVLKAYAQADTLALRELLADEFTFGFPDGSGFGIKESEIGGMVEAVDSSYVLKHEVLVVKEFGDSAISTGVLVEQGTYNGRQIDARTHFTNTWIKINDRWQMAAAHATYVPNPAQ